ncbi:hypothetical protein SCUCBS95973_003127 [Sporothrix curviconia]|uniref:Aminoglycoside phosphotransferase domain-containing protein n=1 Tax=Sporothrix curviconia TaxID=1260050 RepID=A0ABP0BCN8_9PEZI
MALIEPSAQFEFPFVDDYDVLDSAFFKDHTVRDLPTPDQVRRGSLRDEESSSQRSNYSLCKTFFRPSVWFYRHLGVAVKYGHHVRRQTFLYMELVNGVHPYGVNSASLARQVQDIVKMLRSIPQSLVSPTPFVGHINGRPLRNSAIINSPTPVAWPFESVPAFHDWLATEYGKRDTSFSRPQGAETGSSVSAEHRQSLVDDIPIVFTHGDLQPCNVILDDTQHNDGPPRIRAIVDWAQAGWLPLHWEWCTSGDPLDGTEERDADGEDNEVKIVKKEVVVKSETEEEPRTAEEVREEADRYSEAAWYFMLRGNK